MKNETFYIPIKSANLAHYFVKGCICPSLYIQNRIDDIQSGFESYLLLSNKKFIENTSCSLEIVLDDNTEIVKKISANFYLLDSALPISRIKNIIFNDEQQKTNTVFNITSGAGFLPLNLIKVEPNSDSISSKELDNVKMEKSKNNWKPKLDFFNMLLGGFAIMKIAKNEVENYSENYFDTLASISNIIGDELMKQSFKISDKYKWAIVKNGKYTQLNEMIYSTISEPILMAHALDEGIVIKKENGKYKLDTKDEHSKTYLISILASYGEGTRMSIDSFISDLVSNKFPEERKEGIGLIFGINKGYEIFRNEYKTNNFQVDVKFKMDSLLDYYTIETIYQYSFNDKICNEKFEYLDNWVSKSTKNIKSTNYETFTILDNVIVTKKKDKIELPEFFKPCFQSSSRDKIYQIIVSEITKLLPTYIIEKNTKEGIEYFKTLLENDFEKYSIQFFNQIKKNINNENEKNNSETKLVLINKTEALETEKKLFLETIELKNKELENLKSELEQLKKYQVNTNTILEKQEVEKENVEQINILNIVEEKPLEYKNEKVDPKPIKKASKKAVVKKNKPTDDLTMFPNG
ncbi:MAG: hypothetical protein IPN93_16605 [Bacteroidetes bacterium]|nr:hypothetical protein [Bacteroidota bacterium]